jgi:hypothetical protein
MIFSPDSPAGDIGRRLVFEVKGPQGFILTLARRRRLGEEASTYS